MSPQESTVKISNLSVNPHRKVNGMENEEGSHEILSLQMPTGLHIG
ncbi:hypothetical protein FHS51_000544 [Sphingobium wenxiniae]|uniref:Uncharacterized protein n=1 Tax=Sphingobium wenxiniae (strain DSM 21828 / CGMCC 1.7748 / JZ-1) TaxID=595605 RepID=A0A562KI26_SPHWJ|nr:hypothetical protein [Sphingobium wenxiniae]TWH95050.1 hypothetical protein IQ35_01302 [Sphingobium wenxiniae]